mmetsp:Transcript_96411/g.276934  ORF Transcript_96411/g.276934 Transcript_96411/m.276934 type:complete len:459 (+) Transcript_96411:547-1923(+)
MLVGRRSVESLAAIFQRRHHLTLLGHKLGVPNASHDQHFAAPVRHDNIGVGQIRLVNERHHVASPRLGHAPVVLPVVRRGLLRKDAPRLPEPLHLRGLRRDNHWLPPRRSAGELGHHRLMEVLEVQKRPLEGVWTGLDGPALRLQWLQGLVGRQVLDGQRVGQNVDLRHVRRRRRPRQVIDPETLEAPLLGALRDGALRQVQSLPRVVRGLAFEHGGVDERVVLHQPFLQGCRLGDLERIPSGPRRRHHLHEPSLLGLAPLPKLAQLLLDLGLLLLRHREEPGKHIAVLGVFVVAGQLLVYALAQGVVLLGHHALDNLVIDSRIHSAHPLCGDVVLVKVCTDAAKLAASGHQVAELLHLHGTRQICVLLLLLYHLGVNALDLPLELAVQADEAELGMLRVGMRVGHPLDRPPRGVRIGGVLALSGFVSALSSRGEGRGRRVAGHGGRWRGARLRGGPS